MKDINFRDVSIPDIRNKAIPVQKFSERFRLDIVNKAIRATINAMPPKGNRKAGIVRQTISEWFRLIARLLSKTGKIPPQNTR